MKTGKYMIYKFYNSGTDTYETEFFLPDDTFQRTLYRLLTIASYKDKGSQIAGVLYVDKESYLNARLNLTVEEYIDNDRYEQEVRQQYRRGQMKREVYLDTMKCTQDLKWSYLKKIDMQIRRILREGFNVENEIALQLYDQYLQAIL